MIGYMGFGLQKWIYSREPRKKPFEKRQRIASFTPVENNYNRIYKLQKHKNHRSKTLDIIYLIVTVSALTATIIWAKRFENYSDVHRKEVLLREQKLNREAFSFLMSSGRNRLTNNNTKGAYSEFKLAYNLDQNNVELNKLYLISLQMLCNKEKVYCDELEHLYKDLIN